MPSILTPPDTGRRRKRPDDLGDGDNGSGRRPPTDKRTGGNGDNGDGDDWSDRPRGQRGPRDRLSQVRMGLFFGLVGVLMFFIAIVSAFFVTKVNGHFDPHGLYVYEWQPTAVPRILELNTLILLLSSLCAEMARRSMFRETDVMDEWIGLGRPTSRRATAWLSVTLLFGTLFLAGQSVAWKQLALHGLFFRSNNSAHFFYIFTVAHAVHLLGGIVALIATLIVLHRGRHMLSRQILVDATVWYWHAMGLLWLCLFALLEFGQ
jgi:cytochrome c oxidase subunit III